jgi:shikimate kinase
MKVFLVGFMGAGKTTLGRMLAEQLNVPFIDLDQLIQKYTHQSIPQIFEKKGEDTFRKIETRLLHQTVLIQNAVIATGGGTPCFHDNMEWMNQEGSTLWLTAPFEIIYSRLSDTQMNRPLAQNENQLRLLFEQRSFIYQNAHYTISIDQPINVCLDTALQYIKENK